jgi:hypothetical protein
MTKQEIWGIRIARVSGYIVLMISLYKLDSIWLSLAVSGFIIWMPSHWVKNR